MTTFVRGLVATIGLVLGLLSAVPAIAQGSPREAEARSVFDAGQVAFTSGHYADALVYFKRAYELSQRPALLFNIGLCADRLRDDDAAIEAYDRYLAEVPLAANRREVDDRLEALRRARTRREATARAVQPANVAQASVVVVAPRPVIAPEGAAAPGRTHAGLAVYETWWFWTIVGVVVVGAVVGIGVAVSGDDPLQPGDVGGVLFALGTGR